ALRRFYRDWYRPDLMAVVAVGDFDAMHVEALIRRYFAGIPPARSPRPRPVYEIPGHAETLVAIATDPEATGSGVAVYYKQPVRERRDLAAYRQALVERLYNAMFNQRLFELRSRPSRRSSSALPARAASSAPARSTSSTRACRTAASSEGSRRCSPT